MLGGSALVLALAGPVAAHSLQGRYESPLPLVVYLAGAAIAVGLSFAFVLLHDTRAETPPLGASRVVPAPLRYGLRTIGFVGWAWILVQAILGGGSDADVASLFLWVFGWVGLAMVSAFLGPAWSWLDPFATLHDAGAWLLRTLGVSGWRASPYPARLGAWPAVAGFVFFVWLELVFTQASSGRTLGAILIGYTAITLVGMAQFGRDAWRTNGETFSGWFATLGRLAPFVVDRDDATGVRVRRQPLGAGFETPPWTTSRVVLVAVAAASIIYDGLSQTQPYFDLFGLPSLPVATVILLGFLGLVVAAVLAVARVAGLPALGAGLVPIAVGYLIAHYLTYLLVDGQRILIAISDPFQQGWDLFGTAFLEPSISWLPSGLLWTVQLAAVVGGHMLGAWAGHQAALQAEPAAATDPRAAGRLRRRQVPLALLMIALTVVTLWSLGQAIVAEPVPSAAAGPGGATRHARICAGDAPGRAAARLKARSDPDPPGLPAGTPRCTAGDQSTAWRPLVPTPTLLLAAGPHLWSLPGAEPAANCAEEAGSPHGIDDRERARPDAHRERSRGDAPSPRQYREAPRRSRRASVLSRLQAGRPPLSP